MEDQTNGVFTHFGKKLFVVLLMMLYPIQVLKPPTDTARFKRKRLVRVPLTYPRF